MEGCVFDIQRFSMHDGPGIRTTVFLKGCNLRCFWCHNPESIHSYPEIQVYPEKCIGCGKCLEICPVNAVKAADGQRLFIRDICIHCGKCAEECFAGARILAGKSMDTNEIMEVVERDRFFYMNSGGGVTFSGGEPMLQNDFLKSLLTECKKKSLHTAVDTAGNVPWEFFDEILPYTDLFLYDMKAMDEEKHKAATGVGNKRILENLCRLADERANIIIRIPVIPGTNDTVENMESTAGFLYRLKSIKTVELLSLHLLGYGKYESLGMNYMAKDFQPLDKEIVVKLIRLVHKSYKNVVLCKV